jgi:hypothetical protein
MISRISHQVRKAVPSVPVVIACAVLASAVGVVVGFSPANAKPEFSAQTKMPCGQCHTNPAGGGKLKPFGEKFKANGNKL